MAVLKNSEVVKMNAGARNEKLEELRRELVKANVTAHKTNAKTKEIKKAIARILSFSSTEAKTPGELKKA